MALGALDGFRKASILGNVASCHPSPTQVFIDCQAALDAVSAAAARTGHATADAAATTGFRKEPATCPADGQPTCSAGSTQAQEGKSIRLSTTTTTTKLEKNRSILFLFRKACSSAWACSRGWVCVDAAGECEAEDGADSEEQAAVSRWIEEMARFKTTEVGLRMIA